VYGPGVDMWAIGCLLAEAVLGHVLFESETEIEHLHSVFKVIGTPSEAFWKEASAAKNFSVSFPVYRGFDLVEVADACFMGDSAAARRLEQLACNSYRVELLDRLMHLARLMDYTGALLLARLLCEPKCRASAEEAQRSSFFAALHGSEGGASAGHAGKQFFGVCSDTASTMLRARLAAERFWLQRQASGQRRSSLKRVSTELRATAIDKMFDVAGKIVSEDGLGAGTLHLAAAAFDEYLYNGLGGHLTIEKLPEVAASCLKLADVFTEESREYYKLQNCNVYAELFGSESHALLEREKHVLPHLNFDLQLPTVHWFMRCYLAYSRFRPNGKTAKIASFLADLALFDGDLAEYAPSLRAQCILVMAAFLAQYQTAPGGHAELAKSGIPVVEYLAYWDKDCRPIMCDSNKVPEVVLVMQGLQRTLQITRRRLVALKLHSYEKRHQDLLNTLIIPEAGPSWKLAHYILPGSQRTLFP